MNEYFIRNSDNNSYQLFRFNLSIYNYEKIIQHYINILD